MICMFYSVFLFDIYGDTYGFNDAIWYIIVTFIVVVLSVTAYYYYKYVISARRIQEAKLLGCGISFQIAYLKRGPSSLPLKIGSRNSHVTNKNSIGSYFKAFTTSRDDDNKNTGQNTDKGIEVINRSESNSNSNQIVINIENKDDDKDNVENNNDNLSKSDFVSDVVITQQENLQLDLDEILSGDNDVNNENDDRNDLGTLDDDENEENWVDEEDFKHPSTGSSRQKNESVESMSSVVGRFTQSATQQGTQGTSCYSIANVSDTPGKDVDIEESIEDIIANFVSGYL